MNDLIFILILWQNFIFILFLIGILYMCYLLITNYKYYFNLIKTKNVKFINFSNLTFIDLIILFFNHCRLDKWFLVKFIFTFLCIIFLFPIFLFLIFLGGIILIITLLINYGNSIVIQFNFFKISNSSSFFFDKYGTFFSIIKNNYSDFYILTRILSFFFIYQILKKKNINWNIIINIINKITIGILFLPWYIIYFSIELATFQKFSLTDKYFIVKIFLYIKHFFKNFNIFLTNKILFFYKFSSSIKIYTNFGEYFVNGLLTYIVNNSNNLIVLNQFIIWKKMLKNEFGTKFKYHLALWDQNTQCAMTFTSTSFLKSNDEKFLSIKHTFIKPYYTQYVFLSHLNLNINNWRTGMLESIWKNHNLDNVENYVGFIIKTNLLYKLQTDSIIISQNEDMIKTINTKYNLTQTQKENLLIKAQLLGNNNKKIWRSTLLNQNNNKWNYFIKTKYKEDYISKIHNLSYREIYVLLDEASASNLSIYNLLVNLKQDHQQFKNNPIFIDSNF